MRATAITTTQTTTKTIATIPATPMTAIAATSGATIACTQLGDRRIHPSASSSSLIVDLLRLPSGNNAV